jgi:hypothetical protein
VKLIHKIIWGVLAAIVALWLGGGTPIDAAPINDPATPPPAEPIPDECWVGNDPGDPIAAGSFDVFGSGLDNERAIGTHSRSGMPCGPAVVTTTTLQPTAQRTLPATGSSNWMMAATALAFVVMGGAMSRAARR